MDPTTLNELAEKLKAGKLIAFVGSGMSAPCFPSWSQLLKQLIDKIDGNPDAQTEARQALAKEDYLYAAAVIHYALGANRLAGELKKIFDPEKRVPPEVRARYELLRGLPFQSIFTTNYDHLLHNLGWQAYNRTEVRGGGRSLVHLHGDVQYETTMVLSPLHYAEVRHDAALETLFTSKAATSSFLFLGYSLNDDNIRNWLERICRILQQSTVAQHYALVDLAKWTPTKRALYSELYSIQFIDADLTDKGYPDIDAFLHRLRLEHSCGQAVAYATKPDADLNKWYVDPEVTVAEEKGPGQSLDALLDAWLADESQNLLVLLGEFGTGKSWFAKRAVDRVKGNRKPVLIELRQDRFKAGAGPDDLARAVVSESDIEAFKRANREGSLVLILDAFDEMGLAEGNSINDSFERLRRIVAGKAKVIITSRKELFLLKEDEPGRMRDVHDDGKVTAQDIHKLYLKLFDAPRIARAFAKLGKSEVFEEVARNPRLLDLASRPVLLDLIARDGSKFAPDTKLKDLYERFVQKMIDRGNEEHSSKRRAFAERLAWDIQNSESGSMPAEAVDRLAHVHNADYADLVRSRSLLVRAGNDYAFAHPSFREYLVARQVGQELKPSKLTNPTIEFLRELWTWPAPEVVHGTGKYAGMVKVRRGRFIYGQGDKPGEARIEEIEKDFWIDRLPVTNALYLEFLKAKDPKNENRWINHGDSRIKSGGMGLKLQDPKYADHPVVGVMWHGANEFAKAVGKRLPTEQEWEKAARGVDGRVYPWGDNFSTANCNTAESGIGDTTVVGAYANGVSSAGALDMAGNVLEWTATDGERAKVLRGGCWDFNSDRARCASRNRNYPDDTIVIISFRCART